MNDNAITRKSKARKGMAIGHVLMLAVLLLISLSSGCSQLRLPAIDPSGSCLFSPLPTTTTLALPGCNGDGCLNGLKSCLCPSCVANPLAANSGCNCFGCLGGLGCLSRPFSGFPDPAFPEPEPPPPCSAPDSTIASGAAGPVEPCVPGPTCGPECQQGPPAVLFGSEIGEQDSCKLPDSGQRGCILLSPQKIVAPVGGEVILLSGICGPDGYLQMGQPLEWMLTPDSVGTFIQVGDDDPGMLHQLAGMKKAEKHDPSYAHGVTSTKRTLITRGNLDRSDDVLLEKGQTWLSLSSPSEGTSRVTVLAPDSECWDQRKATATIYWIDARWQFPNNQSEMAGTPVSLNTRVTRAEGTLPAIGWTVRYEIQDPSIASFAGTNGSSVVEVKVDESGNAGATLNPTPGTSGTTAVKIDVIRPGGATDNMPTMTLGSGSVNVTWSSPQLRIEAAAPEVASFDVPYEVVARLSNPGDQAANNVRVSVELPPGTRAVSADSFAQVLPNAVVWEIGTLPPQQQLDLFMTVSSQSPVAMIFQARGDAGLVSESTVRVDIYRPSLTITATPLRDRYEAGQEVTFNIDVKNTGDRPLRDVQLKAFGDEGMLQTEKGIRDVGNNKADGPLQPGQTWETSVNYTPTRAGRRCVRFEALAEGGQRALTESCVTVINPVPPPPALTVRLDGKDRVQVGDRVLLRAYVTNSGQVPLRNTEVMLTYDPQLQLLQATEGAEPPRMGQLTVRWPIENLAVDETRTLEAQFEALATSTQSQARLSATSRDGTTAQTDLAFAIVAGPPPVAPPSAPPPSLPPALPPPAIPGGPGLTPPQNPNQPVAPALPPSAGINDSTSGQVKVEIFGRDNPVQVGEPIRYTLRVTNDSNQNDGEVSVKFNLPTGVRIESIAQRRSPVGGQYEIKAGEVYLADIRSMRPGETVEYDLVLVSNQPQQIDLMVESVSRVGRGGSDRVTTEVIP